MNQSLRLAKLGFLGASMTLMAACSGGSKNSPAPSPSLDGVYYLPKQDLGEGYDTPESIFVFQNNILTDYSVHYGHVVKSETVFTQNGNTLFPSSREEQVYDCNGAQVKMAALDGSLGVEMTKLGENLQYKIDETSVTLTPASQEDFNRISTLPPCKKL